MNTFTYYGIEYRIEYLTEDGNMGRIVWNDNQREISFMLTGKQIKLDATNSYFDSFGDTHIKKFTKEIIKGRPDAVVHEVNEQKTFKPVQKFRLEMVRESHDVYDSRTIITSSYNAKQIIGDTFKMNQQCEEVFVMISLSTKNEVIGAFEISRGGANSTILDIKSVMKRALLSNAVRIMVAHNHPSGDPSPSDADLVMTSRLAEAGRIMSVDLLDHLIFGDEVVSLKETNPESFEWNH